jgi:hypothetical protein
MSTKSNIKKIDAINNKIDEFRKNFTNRYDDANKAHNAYIQNLVERFYAKPSNANKIYKGKEKSEFDMNTSTILAPYLIQWEELINEYKKLTGNVYKKPILYNANKEEALKANQAEKDTARKARDELLAKKEVEKAKAKPVVKAKPVKPPKNTGYAEAKKLYNKPPAPLEEINIPTVKVQVKSNNKLFSDMKDLINTIIESQPNIKGMQKSEEIAQLKSIKQKLNKIPKNVIITPIEEIKEDKKAKRKEVRAFKKANLPVLQPWYPEEHGNRDRTGKLMSDQEIAQLKRIREKLKQSKIPENVIISPIQEIKEEVKEEVKRKRGRPIVQGSKRQAKLASTEPVIPKRRGRPPKKVIIEESKEETKQEESKEDIAPKRKRGRPIVEGSKRQAKLAVSEPKKPRGRPKKIESKIENVEPKKSKAGRPSKCSSIPPKSNIIETNTFTRPIIEWIDIDKKLKIKPSQIVSILLLKYSKMNKDLFFDIMETLLKNRLSPKVKYSISKTATKQDLFLIFKKICAFAIHYGFTTAYEIENALILRIKGDLQTDPKALKRFEGFLKKNCIGKQSGEVVKAKTATKPKKEKVYKIEELTNFYEVPIDKKLKESNLSFGDILANNFIGINKSIRLNDKENIEIIDYEMDEEGNELEIKSWRPVNSKKMLLKGLIRRILDALKETNEDTYEELDKLYKNEPEYVFENLQDYI